ncbi:MAG: SDR family oxidoreductase [Filimonas sp.]|nr:SDR family oxidoreductase [Filimonas sp.]
MKKLQDKVVFITGANSGIGKAAALEAAREGAKVVIADLAQANHQATVDEVSAIAKDVLFVPIDVSDVESVKKAINTTVEKFGRLDVAFNNAGVGGPYAAIHETEEKNWERIIQINLTGQFYCIKYELQQFLKQGGGIIVNTSSLAGLKAEHGLVAYTAAKHGVLGITKNIAVQYADKNIRANALCPYYIETPLIDGLGNKEIHDAWVQGTPAKRLGRAEEVAKAFIFFACDDSSYCNGTYLAIDGGVMA